MARSFDDPALTPWDDDVEWNCRCVLIPTRITFWQMHAALFPSPDPASTW